MSSTALRQMICPQESHFCHKPSVLTFFSVSGGVLLSTEGFCLVNHAMFKQPPRYHARQPVFLCWLGQSAARRLLSERGFLPSIQGVGGSNFRRLLSEEETVARVPFPAAKTRYVSRETSVNRPFGRWTSDRALDPKSLRTWPIKICAGGDQPGSGFWTTPQRGRKGDSVFKHRDESRRGRLKVCATKMRRNSGRTKTVKTPPSYRPCLHHKADISRATDSGTDLSFPALQLVIYSSQFRLRVPA